MRIKKNANLHFQIKKWIDHKHIRVLHTSSESLFFVVISRAWKRVKNVLFWILHLHEHSMIWQHDVEIEIKCAFIFDITISKCYWIHYSLSQFCWKYSSLDLRFMIMSHINCINALNHHTWHTKNYEKKTQKSQKSHFQEKALSSLSRIFKIFFFPPKTFENREEKTQQRLRYVALMKLEPREQAIGKEVG